MVHKSEINIKAQWTKRCLVNAVALTDICDRTCQFSFRGRRGRDRIVVGFTPTCAISAYHH